MASEFITTFNAAKSCAAWAHYDCPNGGHVLALRNGDKCLQAYNAQGRLVWTCNEAWRLQQGHTTLSLIESAARIYAL